MVELAFSNHIAKELLPPIRGQLSNNNWSRQNLQIRQDKGHDDFRAPLLSDAHLTILTALGSAAKR